MKLLKNQWSNIIFIVIILALIIPSTRKPIQIFVNKLISFAPSVTDEEERETIASYNWALEDVNGKRVDFNQFKGEVIVVNFWATWCPPCLAEMPSFQELHEDYGNKVRFLFVSNEEHETVDNFMKRKRFDLPSFKMLSQAPAPMDGRTLPTTYVLNKKGQIVVEKVGSADWNSDKFRKTLDGLLAE
ncbi:MAG: TlpA disulfide reductase family protein [Bacteroidota bacterium]|uniref:Cytochrome c biogenesis (Thioredoxin) n=1 Tax=Christiangramia flava JLT2011 TaxID=1229726 RepID=A0A1L7I0T1_9FLAO|nr:TlpA disulfide reductase family protein [Christiangramia flava]APU67210.1 cytochrome c biogenesis (thioredoxin) [Christiangramia flava JLT2011]MAM17746.1 thiol-disulfide oxidoreductase [Christiangramia sp.]MEE2773161.1 TlpA disulfide reductase family protein [Bacteroidota bacterium]OSS39795.1 putative thioredoxin [Christiangramia flava JLT2011]